MSSLSQTPTSSSKFELILDAALSEYKKKTGNDRIDDWLARELQSCDCVGKVLDQIHNQAETFDKFSGDKLMKWVGKSMHVLFKISSTLGSAAGTVCTIHDDLRYIITSESLCRRFLLQNQSLVQFISSSLFVHLCSFCRSVNTLQAAKGVWESHDVLINLFQRIHFFLKRLAVHTRISPTKDMVEILVKIMAEVISILSIATGRPRSHATPDFTYMRY